MTIHGRSETGAGDRARRDEVPSWLDEVLGLSYLPVDGDDMQRAARAAVREAFRGFRRAEPLLAAAQFHGENPAPLFTVGERQPPSGVLVVRAYVAERLHRLLRRACLPAERRRRCYGAIQALGDLEKRDGAAWAGLVAGFPPLPRQGRAATAEARKIFAAQQRAREQHRAAGGDPRTRPIYTPVRIDEGPRGALAALEELEGLEWNWLRHGEASELHAAVAGAEAHYQLPPRTRDVWRLYWREGRRLTLDDIMAVVRCGRSTATEARRTLYRLGILKDLPGRAIEVRPFPGTKTERK